MGNYSTSYYYVVDFVYTYIPSLLTEPTVVPAIRFRYTLYIYYLVTVLIKLNNILPKALVTTPLTAVTTLGVSGDTSIVDINSQLITRG